MIPKEVQISDEWLGTMKIHETIRPLRSAQGSAWSRIWTSQPCGLQKTRGRSQWRAKAAEIFKMILLIEVVKIQHHPTAYKSYILNKDYSDHDKELEWMI